MANPIQVGDRLHAKYSDGRYYAAEVVAVSESRRRAKNPVKVHFKGYDEDEETWLPLTDLKSKKLADASAPEKPAAAAAREGTAPALDFSGLEKGLVLQARADDGIWYKAEVVAWSKKRGSTTPIKVTYVGYTSASDEWLGLDRLRSKALKAATKAKAKAKAKAKVKAQAKVKGPPKSGPALQTVPMLKHISKHAESGLEKAVVESGPSSELKTLSYKALLANVEENSKVIASLCAGASADLPKHVAFLVNPGFAYVVTELSIWAAGAACVPLSIHSPAPELEYFIENSGAKLLIADESMAKLLAPVAEKFTRSFAKVAEAPSEGSLKFQISAQGDAPTGEGDTAVVMSDHALILYTSGTTGKPKGAVHTFSSVSGQYASLSKAWKWSSKDYTLHVLPLHHIHGVQNILNTAIYNGATVEFCPFDAGWCLKRLCSGDITCFHAVPTIYVKFTQHLEKLDDAGRAEISKGLRNDSLRYMVSGSAALPVPTMKSWAEISGHVLLERYGMTEIGMGLSNKIDGTRFPGCVGWPLPRQRVKLDEDGAILIKGPLLFKEYYKNEEATKKEFTEDGWFKTGDSAQCGGTGEEQQQLQDDARAVEASTGRPRPETQEKAIKELENIYKIMGRSSVDIIKSGGYKISALEIESVLLQHEKIKECAVVGKPDETWGEKVTAVCVVDGDLAIKELRDWGKERMATYKVPQELEVVTELPRNQMGKLEKKKILERYKK